MPPRRASSDASGTADESTMTERLFNRIAKYYDVLHEDVDYPAEVALLEKVFARFLARHPASVLDLGCGTGSHALILGERGFRVTGLDASPAMLRVARAKARGRPNPAFVRADMRSFDLGGTFDAAICMDGAFTHLLTDHDVLAHLRAVRRHLSPGGAYVFEFAKALHPETEGQGWIVHDGPVQIVWLYDLSFDRSRQRLTAENRFFAFAGDRLRRRFVNTYSTRVMSVAVLRRLLARAGMRLVRVYSTDEGSGLRPLRRDDPLPMAVAKPDA
ncbi:MAG TPA: methyltransferase domain-containing protein [Thermoplasmata archaeon]|nr:methyltransferase domain-containing protein [Thermoplasmata archaeon]